MSMLTTRAPRIDVPSLLRFERKAIAAALNLLEDRRPDRQEQALELLDELASLPAPAHIVGITGPPGVGKSSLISRLIEVAGKTGPCRLGVVAVDPSSKVSGGALLGDRGRMRVPSNAPVYVRSFAARDRLGGLSREAFLAVFLLRHICDVVLVETVGVGQSETDVANLADTVVLVVQPFAGDLIQFIKAGVMEIPDILAVNKADDAALARKAVADVKAALALDRQPSRVSVSESGEQSLPSAQPWSSPVLAVSAAANLNLDALHEAIATHHGHLVATNTLESRRADQAIAWAMGEIQVEVGRVGLEALGGISGVRTLWARQPATWSAARRLRVLLDSLSYGVK